MRTTPPPSAAAAELRRRAEGRLRTQQTATARSRTEADTKRLLHELQVHQVELEMQNAELVQARAEAEANAAKFSNLYDFAPVGYFTFAEQGSILEVNLTGAALLGVERRRLLNRRFQLWLAPKSVGAFGAFLKRTFGSGARQTCEVNLLKNGAAHLAVQIEGHRVPNSGEQPQCRAVVVDLTERERAEEAIRKLNTELEARVAARTAEISALLEQSRQMQEQLRHLSHQVLWAQEEERRRISRELHDEFAQTLVGINIHLAALSREPTAKPKGLQQRIARTQRLVEEWVGTVQRFIRELRPTVLDDLGLIPALHSYMEDLRKETGLRVHLAASTLARIEGLNSAKRTVLYRVAQEALTNAARHAKASRVEVKIRKRGDAVLMEIRDDGKSFDAERVLSAGSRKRLGLIGMRERVEMVGGSLSVESAARKGTTVRAHIPLGLGTGGGPD